MNPLNYLIKKKKICELIKNNDKLYLNYEKASNESIKTYEELKELQDYLKVKYGKFTLDILEKDDLEKIISVSKPYTDCITRQKEIYLKMIGGIENG